MEVLADFAERRGITYPLLSDAGSATIAEFGILNTVAQEGLDAARKGLSAEDNDPALEADVERYVSVFGAVPFIVGTPFPGTFIVDRDRRVTARFFEDFYRERSTAASIMLRLGVDTNPVAGVDGSTEHLDLHAWQSNPEITAGSIFTVGVDITPREGMHLYAPGAEQLGYRVVRLAFAESPAVRLAPIDYPASEIYHFEPLDERVPVYQTRFTLLQDVVVEASSEAERALHQQDTLTLSAELQYQACNDTLCFDPVALPLVWTVAVGEPDRQRAKRPD